MLLLIVAVATVTILFIDAYCAAFSALGLMAKQRLLDHPAFTFLATPTFFWLSAFICRKYAHHASGNSMGHIKIALAEVQKEPMNREKIFSILSIRVIIVKTISSLLCCFGSGALGREGPAVHMSTSFFAVMGDKFKSFLPKVSLETWIFAGSATGMAVAFHAPISGLVFITEKLIKSKSKKFKNIMIWSFVTIFIYTLVHNGEQMFTVSKFNFEINSLSFMMAIFTACICGLSAFIFKRSNDHLYSKISAIKSNLWHLIPVIAGLVVASISFYCGIHSFSGGIYTANEVLSSSEIILSFKEVIGRALNTVVSFISGCAGGLIAPSIAIGSGIGSIVSAITMDVDTNVFILIGMAAFLSAVLGEPISAAIIVFEITGQSVNSIPLLLCASTTSLYALKGTEKVIENVHAWEFIKEHIDRKHAKKVKSQKVKSQIKA